MAIMIMIMMVVIMVTTIIKNMNKLVLYPICNSVMTQWLGIVGEKETNIGQTSQLLSSLQGR